MFYNFWEQIRIIMPAKERRALPRSINELGQSIDEEEVGLKRDHFAAEARKRGGTSARSR